MEKTIKCPNCGASTKYSNENLFRPFCSERCQLIDLGEWADEKYSVPVSEVESENPISRDSEEFDS